VEFLRTGCKRVHGPFELTRGTETPGWRRPQTDRPAEVSQSLDGGRVEELFGVVIGGLGFVSGIADCCGADESGDGE
jgi:hypothetical protein